MRGVHAVWLLGRLLKIGRDVRRDFSRVAYRAVEQGGGRGSATGVRREVVVVVSGIIIQHRSQSATQHCEAALARDAWISLREGGLPPVLSMLGFLRGARRNLVLDKVLSVL